MTEKHLNEILFLGIMIRRELILLSSVTYILSISTVYGYIDPGTGGMIIGSLGSVIAVIAAIIGGILGRYLIRPLKRIFQQIRAMFKEE
jgi:hypothetical protein